MAEVWFQCATSQVQYDVDQDKVIGGPWEVSALWSGLPADFQTRIDAAVNYGNGKAYLFSADSYVRVDIATRTCETAAKSIADNWAGMADAGFAEDIHAAVNYGNGTVYFFKDDQFCAYDIAQDAVSGSAGSISQWALAPDGSFDIDLDAAVNYGNGRVYFFRADSYVRYDTTSGVVSEIRSVADNWPGMGDAGFGRDLRGSWCTAAPAGAAAPPSGGGARTALAGGADIDAWFTQATGQGFIDWYNANHAGKGLFVNKQGAAITLGAGADTRTRFTTFWNTIPTVFGTATITLEQFVALQCIILNELGGSMTPVSEFTGPAGLAYLYNATGKASYNTGPLSHSALVCFSDPVFLAAHQGKAFGPELANTQDPVWGGNVYPADRYPTDMTAAGMIAEADFCKFRGRGMIQTTWRTGYLPLIGFVQGYTGSQATVLGYTTRWAGMSRDDVASSSSNADWDDLYQHSDYLIPSKAISLHSQGGGGYLAISTDPAVRTGTGQGSFHNMGKKISGNPAYGTTFQGRCAQILDSLPA
jgi:hypothetical protein